MGRHELLIAVSGFASSWMLLWAAAAAIPIVIHLLMQRRQQTVTWAAMQMLQRVIEQESKRLRIEQLILLAMRISLLLILALAVARPFWNASRIVTDEATRRAPRLHLICIDSSYSMGLMSPTEDPTSSFELAKRRAAEIVEESIEGDAFVLLDMGHTCHPLVRFPTFDRSRLLEEIRKMSVRGTGCNLESTINLIADMVTQPDDNSRYPQQWHVYLLSDLGTDTWESYQTSQAVGALAEVANRCTIHVEPLLAKTRDNLAITSLEADSFRPLVGHPVELRALVENFSEQQRDVSVEFSVDGQTVGTDSISVAAGGTTSTAFQYTPRNSGSVVLEARIGDDRLQADNQRAQVIQVRDRTRVLLVEQRNESGRLLKTSLAPTDEAQRQFAIQTTSAIDLVSDRLDNQDLIILHDIGLLESETYRRLASYVESGGSLLVLLGPETSAAKWNSIDETDGLLGFQLMEPSPKELYAIDAAGYDSPLTRPFAGFPDTGLLTTPIFRYWQVDNLDERHQVDLRLSNGDPLVVVKRLDRGVVGCVLSVPQAGLEDDWNAIASWPSFVPLVQQLCFNILDRDTLEQNLLAGSVIVGQLSEGGGQPDLTLTTPRDDQIELRAESVDGSNRFEWLFDQTTTQGIYVATEPSGLATPYAVNLDPIESSLVAVELDRLPRFEPPQSTNADDQQTDDDLDISDRLPRILLGLLILLLFAESSFAWWVGRRIR